MEAGLSSRIDRDGTAVLVDLILETSMPLCQLMNILLKSSPTFSERRSCDETSPLLKETAIPAVRSLYLLNTYLCAKYAIVFVVEEILRKCVCRT